MNGSALSIIANTVIGLVLAVIYTEWKTLHLSLGEDGIQSVSFFHRRELRYSDIQSAGIVLVPMGGASLRIVGRNGKVLKIDNSLDQFETFAEAVKKLVEGNGGIFEEPRVLGRRR